MIVGVFCCRLILNESVSPSCSLFFIPQIVCFAIKSRNILNLFPSCSFITHFESFHFFFLNSFHRVVFLFIEACLVVHLLL